MKFCLLCLFLVNILVVGTARLRHKSNTVTISNIPKEITIPVKVHLDFQLSKKIAKEHGFKKRKKIKEIVYSFLKETNKIFRRPSLNQTIILKLLDIKFLRKTKNITMDENATNYLRSYCELQNRQKELAKKNYYSILLTSLNLFYMNNGKKFTKSTGRSYRNGVCNLKKSCALIEWNPNNMAYLLAHEIGHSLGMPHDGPPNNNCINFNGIMKAKYDPSNNPNTWSLCSRLHFEYFLRSEKAWCLNKGGSHVHSMYKNNG